MRISDWSSDVCSSDLVHADAASPRNLDRIAALGLGVLVQNRHLLKGGDYVEHWGREATANAQPIAGLRERGVKVGLGTDEIGRASCRESVCQYVSIAVVAVSLKRQEEKRRKQE